MVLTKILQEAKKFEIQSYARPRKKEDLAATHIAFSGSVQMHPYEDNKLILITDPFGTHTSYLEFRTKDISYIEELSKIANVDGETVSLMRIWVKKMSIALQFTPFVVGDTR